MAEWMTSSWFWFQSPWWSHQWRHKWSCRHIYSIMLSPWHQLCTSWSFLKKCYMDDNEINGGRGCWISPKGRDCQSVIWQNSCQKLPEKERNGTENPEPLSSLGLPMEMAIDSLNIYVTWAVDGGRGQHVILQKFSKQKLHDIEKRPTFANEWYPHCHVIKDNMVLIVNGYVWSLLPPANEVWGKVTFYTCLSAHRVGGYASRAGLHQGFCIGGGDLYPEGSSSGGVGHMHINEMVIEPTPWKGHCGVWPDIKNTVGFRALWILLSRYQTWYLDTHRNSNVNMR